MVIAGPSSTFVSTSFLKTLSNVPSAQRALARLRTASAGAYIYVSTLVAVVGGIAILGEPVTLAMVGGGGMVIAGVVLAQQLKKRES